jgi:hypothetical protein
MEYLKNMKALITLVCAALLCIFIFIPLITVCFSFVFLRITPRWVPYSIYSIMLISLFNVVAFAFSGALMALLISLILKNCQVISTLWASLLVTVVYVLLYVCFMPDYFMLSTFFKPQKNVQFILITEMVLRTIFFWLCAYGVAWFMEHKFRKSVKPMDAALISDSKQ